MTYNIHHAEGVDGRVDIERIAKVILESKVDLVALQEVDRGVERTGKIDMMTALSDLTGMTYAFGKSAEVQGGDFGNGVLTRFPILAEKNIPYQSCGADCQQSLFQLVIEVRGTELAFMNTQLDSNAEHQNSGVQAIRATARGYAPRPVLICGDFNDLPESKPILSMKEDFSDCWRAIESNEGFTYSSSKPSKRIDYVFVSKRAVTPNSQASLTSLRPIRAQVLEKNASTHHPLIVEFEITPE